MEVVFDKIRYNEEFGEMIVLGFDKHVNVTNIMDLFIPDTVQNKPVTRIAMRAFCNTNIVTASLPVGLSEIGNYCFADCEKLKVVNIGDIEEDNLPYMLTIRAFAFANCPNLSTFDAWSRTTYVERFAFRDCVALLFADMCIRYLEPGAFKNCHNLQKLSLEEDSVLYDDSLQDCGVTGLCAIRNAKFSELTLEYILQHNIKISCIHDSPLLDLVYNGFLVETYSAEEEKSILGIF